MESAPIARGRVCDGAERSRLPRQPGEELVRVAERAEDNRLVILTKSAARSASMSRRDLVMVSPIWSSIGFGPRDRPGQRRALRRLRSLHLRVGP
jgi:hypothetical protein